MQTKKKKKKMSVDIIGATLQELQSEVVITLGKHKDVANLAKDLSFVTEEKHYRNGNK